MRNYELIQEIKAICDEGSEHRDITGAFKNNYLNDVIAITKLIEKERPYLAGRGGAEESAYELEEEEK